MEEGLDFEVDKIVNSIEEVVTGIRYKTNVVLVTEDEIKRVHKKDGWGFNWKKEFEKSNQHIYKLVIKHSNTIQGLISIELIPDERYVEMHLIENAPHNRKPDKKFFGVAPNLVAFACKLSFDSGFEGIVGFTPKTSLVDHYRNTLGAQSIFKNRMAIYTNASRKLIDLYYDNS